MKNIHKDFHGALSCGFEYLQEKHGRKALNKYLFQAGENIYKDLIKKIKKRGLSALEEYWNYIFDLEEADFKIKRKNNEEIVLKVIRCPTLDHMRKMKYKIYKDFCRQCKIINYVIAQKTGFESKVISHQNKNSCIQKLWRRK